MTALGCTCGRGKHHKYADCPLAVPGPPAPPEGHEHEAWQVRDDGAGPYCAACGQRPPASPEGPTSDGVAALLAAAEGTAGWGEHVRLTRDDVADWLRGRAEEWPRHPWNPAPRSPEGLDEGLRQVLAAGLRDHWWSATDDETCSCGWVAPMWAEACTGSDDEAERNAADIAHSAFLEHQADAMSRLPLLTAERERDCSHVHEIGALRSRAAGEAAKVEHVADEAERMARLNDRLSRQLREARERARRRAFLDAAELAETYDTGTQAAAAFRVMAKVVAEFAALSDPEATP